MVRWRQLPTTPVQPCYSVVEVLIVSVQETGEPVNPVVGSSYHP
jgi:hypothetical protein